MPYPPRVFTVVLNYRNHEDTLQCVGSLRRSDFPTHLVVVDNASGTEEVSALRRALPATPILETGDNLGYAGGNNVGIRWALEHGADYVWIINADATVEPGTLRQLVGTMTRMPNAGIGGCKIMRGKTVWFNGARIDWSRGGAASHVDIGKREADLGDDDVRSTDYVTGASMLVRAQVFDDVGLLPERYFLYFEETDLNVRAFRKGWQLIVDPKARAHHEQRSWEEVPSVRYVFYYTRNRILFGSSLSDWSVEDLIRDFEPSIEDWWRARFRKARPEWLPAFERIVSMALQDARAGREGRRDEITGLSWEAAASA